MPFADIKQLYVLSVTNEEYRLIGLALAGKLKSAEDITAALTLNEALCRIRVAALEDQLDVATAACARAKEARGQTHENE